MEERRKRSDRRKTFWMPKFPLTDSNGRIVLKDRRVCPERRISAIQIHWGFEKRKAG